MTRQAIIIGLGGTGQWVLTYLKKNLLEENGGVIPPEVRLLCFDTESSTSATTGQSIQFRKGTEDIRSSAAKLLDGKEFFHLGKNTDLAALVRQIAEGNYAHMQWFPARSFLSKLSLSAFNSHTGAGQIRQMGRLALFSDVGSEDTENDSIILKILRDAFNLVSRDMQLEIMVVGSLAGGTGSGMLFDVALLQVFRLKK